MQVRNGFLPFAPMFGSRHLKVLATASTGRRVRYAHVRSPFLVPDGAAADRTRDSDATAGTPSATEREQRIGARVGASINELTS